MQVIIIPRSIQEDHQPDHTIRIYLEFEFTRPGQISRVNVSKQSVQFLNLCRELVGKEVVLGLEESEYNGRKFWRVSDPNIQLIKMQPVTQATSQPKAA
ncbi:hypothetical protein [Methylomonas koyamae]|uniref:hypothetical protein n=1 Tax=Methylomonas koyamae TaxID=702114 RepID=UPI0011274308|nr:hypothetical protein [Methylomonas koyamae]TPQ24993.1 hypothetical protein C2U68_17080 [Methylomonas koyamae]